MIAYKITDKNLQSRGNYQWVVGEWREESGEGELCGPGWLHFYESPEMAALLCLGHLGSERIKNGLLLWRAEVDGDSKFDSCVKFGATRGRILEKVELPSYTEDQRVALGILCAYPWASEIWQKWADKWLTGEDRSFEGTKAAMNSVETFSEATEAEYCAARAAAMRTHGSVEMDVIRAVFHAGTTWAEPGAASRMDQEEILYILLCAEAAKDF